MNLSSFFWKINNFRILSNFNVLCSRVRRTLSIIGPDDQKKSMDFIQNAFPFPDFRDFQWSNMKLPLNRDVQIHLRRVYSTLMSMFLVTALGAAVDTYGYLPWTSSGLITSLATIGSLIMFYASGNGSSNRPFYLYAFSFFKGLSLGPLISAVYFVSPASIPVAMVCTALIFGSFSLSVIYAGRTQGSRMAFNALGFAMSLLSSVFWLSLANLFIRSSTLQSLEMYAGLAAFSGFVVYDTQLVIAKAEAGSKDHMLHAVQLYTDAVAIFVRILVLLYKKNAQQKRKEDKRRRETRSDL